MRSEFIDKKTLHKSTVDYTDGRMIEKRIYLCIYLDEMILNGGEPIHKRGNVCNSVTLLTTASTASFITCERMTADSIAAAAAKIRSR